MANREHISILKKGISHWNLWREQNREIQPDFSDANLSHLKLNRANFQGADFRRANLTGCSLKRAKFFEANLKKADLTDAHFGDANLAKTDLSESHLVNANLTGANLSNANLTNAWLSGADISWANLTSADLTGAVLLGSDLVETRLKNAKLIGCHVYGVSVWNVNLTGAIQRNLIITPVFEPNKISVDNLEIAQFIHTLLFNKKIRGVIDEITSRVVLILGRFSPERKKILDAIREELPKHNLVPIIFDFEEPKNRDVIETAMTLAYMARFVIVDLTEASSVIHELPSIVEKIRSVPVKPIQSKSSRKIWAGYQNLKRYDTVLDIYQYKNENELIKSLKEKIIDPSEFLRMRLLEKREIDRI